MNKEQAKLTIEKESLLRQETKRVIRKNELPVTDRRFSGHVTSRFENEDMKLAPELYENQKIQTNRYAAVNKGSRVKAKGPLSVSGDKEEEGIRKLKKTRFFEKKKETVLKGKRFIASEDDQRPKTKDEKHTKEELRQIAYFKDKISDKKLSPKEKINEDDKITYRKASRRRLKKTTGRYIVTALSQTKYHTESNEQIQEDSVDTVRNVTGYVTGKSSRFIPDAIKKVKNKTVSDMDLAIQEKKNLIRFIRARKHDEQIFSDMKVSLTKKITSKLKLIAKRNRIGVIISAVSLAFVLSAIAGTGILFEGISQAAGTYLTGLSLSTDFDMTDCENYYTKMEADLQDVLDNLEEYYPGFNRYIIDFDDEIGHDPIKLMAYLSAVYEGYDLSLIQPVLNELFDEMYMVETETETVIENDEEIKIFSIKIVKTKWDDLMDRRIADDKKDLYDSYGASLGGHQAFHNPFAINWSDKVTSEFGWRIHPISGKEKFHKGVDIGIPTGTPVKSCSKGIVIKSTYSDTEGNYVVVEDDTGYRCHYMHLSQRDVSEGDIVDYDTVIGKVGSTGYSTGPHLHLQITDRNGECLNPRFMVQGGDQQ